ncbi:hypothetical protein ABFS83_14G049600 [Erythranthe nasuta]
MGAREKGGVVHYLLNVPRTRLSEGKQGGCLALVAVISFSPFWRLGERSGIERPRRGRANEEEPSLPGVYLCNHPTKKTLGNASRKVKVTRGGFIVGKKLKKEIRPRVYAVTDAHYIETRHELYGVWMKIV